jgi:hypothetical protein
VSITNIKSGREARLRRIAKRQGLLLQRSRVRDPRSWIRGTYQLVDPALNLVVCYGMSGGFGLDLDEVEEALSERELAAVRSGLREMAARVEGGEL